MCGLYLTGACAEINRIPFDLPEAESELVSGYNTEYSGIKFAIFFLAEFTNLFVVSTIASVMFLGGGDFFLPYDWFYGTGPLGFLGNGFNTFLETSHLADIHLLDPSTFWPAIWLIVKIYTLVFIAILVRGTLPRFRIDQLMDFGWKRLIPIALVTFLFIVFLKVVVATPAALALMPPQ
jgi:NADH:ubiquinone oxidoreductase subunit H